jgi:hypothetical protein
MRVTVDFERYTENFSVYKVERGKFIHRIYLPKIVTCRKQPFDVITTTEKNPRPKPSPTEEVQALFQEKEKLKRENDELRRRLAAIRNLA